MSGAITLPCSWCGTPFTPTLKRRRFCSRDCGGHAFHRPLEQRFREKVDAGEPDACWLWTGYRNPHGYGRMGRGGEHGPMVLAHRLAYELVYGPIPEGMQVCHRCDNPPCCNPAHLFLGDNAANVADKVAKKRQASILTDDDVRAIRSMTVAGWAPRVIAQEFGVKPKTVSKIAARRAWRHVS